MLDYLDRKHMEPAKIKDSCHDNAFYLPHHGVKKETSITTKLKVVFNASFKSTNGQSLNDQLLVGPKLQADIVSVLTQWRTFRFVYCADIAQMYRQILIHHDDRNFQRILWRFNPSEPLEEYRLNTVTFGVSSAPYLALRVLQQLATDEGSSYPLALPVLQHGLYIDDCLFGAEDQILARQTKTQLINLLNRGGFELRKWASNSFDLLSDVKPENHGLAWDKPLQSDDGIKILGIFWNPTNDSFQFIIKLISPPSFTKRTLLSLIARIYDPLGWVSPVVIVAKIILQRLWLLKLDWDAPLPDEVVSNWLDFYNNLPEIEQIRIPRWIGFGSDVIACELHGFSDASRLAYSAVVYVRVITVSGAVTVSSANAFAEIATCEVAISARYVMHVWQGRLCPNRPSANG